MNSSTSSKTRVDAWTKKDDELLARTILTHIREGSTQMNAFDEAGDKMNRTSSACGFRWNAVLRMHYEKEIFQAKKERKQKLRGSKQKLKPLYTPKIQELSDELSEELMQIPLPSSLQLSSKPKKEKTFSLSFDEVMKFLAELKSSSEEGNRIKENYHKILDENETLRREMKKLNEKLENTEKEYQSLLGVMERARKMVLFENEQSVSTSFKMDKNGNLERVAN